ncbi:hypothetical protein [Adonisia turfae]|uniref:hypothetical protein n=1 Tax=Adonisia turfae TaxID=2950184 RepID=UPI0013D6F8D2|nr:hypothetical protein [Adonisia turfae]
MTRNAVYEKLNGIEPQVSRAVLKETAAELSTLMDTMGGKREPLLAGAASLQTPLSVVRCGGQFNPGIFSSLH